MSGPSAGWYDPVLATIKKPVYQSVKGEPKIASVDTVCQRHIRFPRMQNGRETVLQGVTNSVQTVFIRMRRDRVTETILPNMQIIHRGTTYGILAPYQVDYQQDELEFVCNAK